MKSKITPSLWFDNNAHDAMTFYTSVFSDSEITEELPVAVSAKLAGVPFIAINGGPSFKPNSSISFMVVCENRTEIDSIWNKFLEKGKVYMKLDSYPWSSYYGWIGDPYGFTWQLYLGSLEDVNNQRIIPTMMFSHTQQGNCEKAIQFYQSVFKDFQSYGIMRYEEGPFKGQVKHSQFSLENFIMAAMDSGEAQDFTFNPAISFTVKCKDQKEIDYYWEQFTKGGREDACGWCQDPFGVSWQVVPHNIQQLAFSSQKATEALFKMRKIIISDLENV